VAAFSVDMWSLGMLAYDIFQGYAPPSVTDPPQHCMRCACMAEFVPVAAALPASEMTTRRHLPSFSAQHVHMSDLLKVEA